MGRRDAGVEFDLVLCYMLWNSTQVMVQPRKDIFEGLEQLFCLGNEGIWYGSANANDVGLGSGAEVEVS